MTYLIYIILGLSPSIIWLLFFLRKDSHPEPNRQIIKIFFYGMLMTIPAALIEIGISNIIPEATLNLSFILLSLLYNLLVIALVEEFLKYSIVRKKVLSNKEYDEPVDAMLYMIIAALGFAALENILVMLSLTGKAQFLLKEAMAVSFLRFIGATFLHALVSAVVGYFLALSLLETSKRKRLIGFGLAIAVVLHGLYNFSIMRIAESPFFIFLPIIILIGLALFVSLGFRKLKKLSSICKT